MFILKQSNTAPSRVT